MKLLTVFASFDLEARVLGDLRALGASGYTVDSVNGRGAHGVRRYGVVDGANVRVQSLLREDVARAALRLFASDYAEEPVVAFLTDAEAVPANRFR